MCCFAVVIINNILIKYNLKWGGWGEWWGGWGEWWGKWAGFILPTSPRSPKAILNLYKCSFALISVDFF